MNRSGTASVAASPVLIGAVAVLITIIAVFLAYNANQGLPFVPTYDVHAELPSGAKLVRGNEVRAGGFRVGVIDEIESKSVRVGGRERAIATVLLKLDKVVEPLRSDTEVAVRPRSALGLRYLELAPGRRGRALVAGDTLPLRQASEPLDLEDVTAMFDDETRPAARKATEGFGDGFAGRGASLNRAIEELNPFFRHLTPVMRNLADPDTGLEQFFRQLGRAAAQAAPVAETQALLFTDMADTFAALSRDPAALRETIERSPRTLDTAVRSFRVQRPFLADFARLSRELRPAARELPRSLPELNRALRVGTPVLRRTVPLNVRLRRALSEAEDLFENPNTLLALRDLHTALAVTRPAIEFIAPYQTVCNYALQYLAALGEHQSQPVAGGTGERVLIKGAHGQQPNSLTSSETSRPVDLPDDVDPNHPPESPDGEPAASLHDQPQNPAVDAQGNADCQNGQTGYTDGPWPRDLRYSDRPGELGGNHVVIGYDLPGLGGPTYSGGVRRLQEVP